MIESRIKQGINDKKWKKTIYKLKLSSIPVGHEY